MASSELKAKVLFNTGLIAALLGGVYFPETTKTLLPFVACLAISALIAYAADSVPTVISTITSVVNSHFKVSTEDRSLGFIEGTTRATWIKQIDYENYEIPAYARRGRAF